MRPIRLSAALLLASALPAAAQGFTIDSVAYTNEPERCVIAFTTATQNYYRVEFAAHPFTNNLGEVRAMLLGSGTSTNWTDAAVAGFTNGFYRLREIPRDVPLDLDDDGKDDVFELEQGTDPFIPQLDLREGLVINEIDYDQPGADTAEFIEIYNNSTNTLSLTGIALRRINGATNAQYPTTGQTSVDLSGELAPGGFLVIANNAVLVTNTAQVIRFSSAQDSIQNGAPDAVVLFDTIRGQIVDSLSYEGQVTAGNITGFGAFDLTEGRPLDVLEDNSPPNYSLVRVGYGQDTNDAQRDWTRTATITPGYGNVITP